VTGVQTCALPIYIITTAVKGVAEIITLHGNINIDFADVSTVMAGSKVFIMGTGYADGPDRAMKAVTLALESPLLDSSSIHGTKDILLNIISGTEEITMGEIGEIIDYLQDEAGPDATNTGGNGFEPKTSKKKNYHQNVTRHGDFPKFLSRLRIGPKFQNKFLTHTLTS